MSDKGKEAVAPWEEQARQKLAVHVYEYLIYVGAPEAAKTFLSELRWEKNIQLGDPPGFLYPWFCTFLDLYWAASEPSETTTIHDNGLASSGSGVNEIAHNADPTPNPLGQLPPNEGMSGGPIAPAGFVPNSSTRPSHPSSGQSPHPQPPNSHGPMLSGQPSMGPPPGVRMPQGIGSNFNGSLGQQMMPNGMYPTWQVPRGMGPMSPPLGPGMGPLGVGTYRPDMRGPPPNSSLGPAAMPPMGMASGWPQRQTNTPLPINHLSSSTVYYGAPLGPNGTPGGGENMYTPMPQRTL